MVTSENVSRICRTCNKEISPERLRRHYSTKTCSTDCSKLFTKKQYAVNNFSSNYNLPTGTVGVVQELRVAIDLLLKNYEVFHAFSPSCSCDLAVLKDGKLLRVEVTTAYRTGIGTVNHPAKKNKLFDILALVFKDGQIIYEPKLPE